MTKPFFIHIPKNGGMTIRHSNLIDCRIATPDTHKSPEYTQRLAETMRALGDHHGNEHARLRDLKPEIRENHKFFAIIRNPWDRVVSRFFFAKKVIYVEKKVPETYADVSSFEAFLEERHKWGGKEFMWHRAIRNWYPALEHVMDETGEIPVNMLRFECYNEDVCKYFGLKEMTRARNVTALNKGSYKDVYTPETIQIVADWYQEDIEHFGYDFDSGPTRNYWNEY